jgi:hypothetical protein
LLALLGVTPLDFPRLLPPDVLDRWRQSQRAMTGVAARARAHIRRASSLPARERPRYLATRATNLIGRAGSRIRRRPRPDSRLLESLQQAIATHQPRAFPGTALLVLHRDETGAYTNDPERIWEGLADRVELALLPGADHAMLERPGISQLAALIRTAADGA